MKVNETGEGWMIFHFSIVLVHFIFCLLNFTVLSPFLIKYYHIMFIIIIIIIVFCPPWCNGWVIGVRWLGNSSTASGHSGLAGTVGPIYSLGCLDSFFFRARFALFHSLVSLLNIFFCFFVWFDAVLMHECLGKHSRMSSSFPIGNSHTEWYLFFLRQCNYKFTMRIRSEKLEILVH